MYVDLLEEAESGRIYTANFDEDLSYDLIHNGFSWDHTEGMITALNTNPGCIRSDNHMAGTTGTLELYVYSQSSPTIISFWAMLQAGGNNKDTLLITTNCGTALPYSEDFENCAANNTAGSPYGVLPECWNSYNEPSYNWYKGYPTVQTTGYNFNGYSYSGEQHLCMNSYYYSDESYTNLYTILPSMNNLNTVTLSFYACHGRDSYSVPLYVGVMTDPEDINTFELVESIEISGVNTDVWGNEQDGYQYHGYNNYTVDFSSYTGEGKYIAFMMEPATSSNVTQIIYIDDITCESSVVPSASCPTPTGLAASNVTNNSAFLSWNSDNAISSYNVEYREGASINSIFFEEAFNNGIWTWGQYSGLVDSVLADPSKLLYNYNGEWGSSSNVFGASSAKLNIYGDSRKGWLVSPETETTLPSETALTFDLALTGYNTSSTATGTCEDDRFVVLVYADGQWAKLREWNNSGSSYIYNDIATTGENIFIDLSAYEGKYVKIAFYGESTVSGNGDNDLHIDNVTLGTTTLAGEWHLAAENTPNNSTELTELTSSIRYEARIQGNCDGEGTSDWSEPISFTTLPSCFAVTDLQVTQVTNSTATVTWNNGGEESSWDIYVTTDINDVPTAGTTPTEEYTDYKPYLVENLLPATTYYIYVRAVCSETERSTWSSPVTVRTKCEAKSLPYEYGFEDYSEYQYCWSILNTTEDIHTAYNTGTNPHEGSRNLSIWRAASDGILITILPEFEVQANDNLKNYEISLYAKTTSSQETFAGTLHVGVMTDPYDASTFVQVGDDIPVTTDYDQYSVSLNSYTGTGHYIAIKATSGSWGDIYIDDINVSQTAQATYTINIDENIEHGTVEADMTSATAGTTVRLTATPDNGYRFDEWNVTSTLGDVPVAADTFVMPASDVTVSATFKLEKHQLTINYFYYENGTNETAPSYIDSLEYGESYSIVSPSVRGFNPIIDTVKGVMGTNDITVRVGCLPIVYQVTLHPRGGTLLNGFSTDTVHIYGVVLYLPTANDIVREGYTFGSWYPDTNFVGNPTIAIPNVAIGDCDLYAKWDINSYTISASANPEEGGTVTGAGTYNYGTTATLTAIPNTGYTFTNWTKDGVEVSTDTTYSFMVEVGGDYVVNFTQMGTVATPTFSPEPGTYYDFGGQRVTLACATSGATIYYTTNGTEPTSASNVYTTPIVLTVGDTTIIKAIAMKDDMIISESAISQSTRTYTIFAPGIYLMKVGDSIVKKVSIIPM